MSCSRRSACCVGSVISTSPLWCPSLSAESVVTLAGGGFDVAAGVMDTVIGGAPEEVAYASALAV